MMEVLFRGKRKYNGEWVYGSLVHQKDYYGKKVNRYFILEGDNTNDYDIDYPLEVSESEIGQYTGLTDKNGKKIFEGDIVHCHDVTLKRTDPWNEFDGYVDFLDGAYCIVSGADSRYYWPAYCVDVIGNIYDNPELLEGGDTIATQEERI